jgi:hypothetical protein
MFHHSGTLHGEAKALPASFNVYFGVPDAPCPLPLVYVIFQPWNLNKTA